MGNTDRAVEPNYSIDVLRLVAISLVVLLHCSGFPYVFLNAEVTSMDILGWFTTDFYATLGMLGVPLFVMLTGALLLNPNREDEPLKVFYRKRLDRIGLPFVFWTVLYFAWNFTVLDKPLTLTSVAQGMVTGSYAHLWYLFLLMGLYAVTPVLRVLVKHLDRKLFTYLIALWFVGTVSVPFIHTFTTLDYNAYPFLFLDWTGYFLVGSYLLYTNIRRSRAVLLVLLGVSGSVLGEWLVTATLGKAYTGFFHNYMNVAIIVASASLFYLLISLDFNWIGNFKKASQVIHWISQNTLPIYLIHMLVLVSLIQNVAGVWLNRSTFVPLVDVPVYTVIVFSVSAALVYALKKVPGLRKLVG